MASSATSSTRTSARPKAVVIAGPTASGKSGLALVLAEAFGGTVINADSQQRYRDFPILTAQPAPADRARAPHRLFGDLAAHEAGSAVAWAAAAAGEVAAAWDAGRLPIVVGGTGLYLRVLLQGVADIPPVPEDVRARARALLAEIGSAALHARLAARDPAGAVRIPPGNTQRLARAWEVLEATGTPLSVWHGAPAAPALAADCLSVLLMPPRAAVVAACAARFQAMIAAGACDEVAAALARGVEPDAPAMQALGARELADHLAGRLGLAEAVAAAQIATRRYAKRQATWFRHQLDADLVLYETYRDGGADAVAPRVRRLLSRDGA